MLLEKEKAPVTMYTHKAANLNNHETNIYQNLTVGLPSLINTAVPVKNECDSPETLLTEELIIKNEEIDGDDEENPEPDKAFDDEDSKIDLSKIMLNNILQNMYVAKEDPPSASRSTDKVENLDSKNPSSYQYVVPSPIDTTVSVKNEQPSPERLLTEEVSIKNEPVDYMGDQRTKSSQYVTIEVPPHKDIVVPVMNEYCPPPEPLLTERVITEHGAIDDGNEGNVVEGAVVEQGYKIDLNKIMLNNVLQNMFVAKQSPVPNTTVGQPENEPTSLLRQLLNGTQSASKKVQQNKRKRKDTETIAQVPRKKSDGAVKKKRTHKFECADCGKKFRDKFFVRKHIEGVHLRYLETCNICYKKVGLYYLKRHMKMHGDAVYCEPCNKWYCLDSYKVHLKTTMSHVKPEEYRFACDQCEMKFHRNTNLTKHKNRIHLNNEKPYKCSVCPAAYAEWRSLKAHVKTNHEHQERPRNYVCDICGVGMYTKRNLVSHMVRHTGVRPYKCKICGDTFGYSGVLATHVKYVHENKQRNKGTKNKQTKEMRVAKKLQVKGNVKNKRQITGNVEETSS